MRLSFEYFKLQRSSDPETRSVYSAKKTSERRRHQDLQGADTVRLALGIPLKLKVSILSLEEALKKEGEWRQLAIRALEDNIFYEPAFAASAQHLPEAKQPYFAFVENRKQDPDFSTQLLGIVPFSLSRLDIGAPVIRIWHHVNSALATPLIDKECAKEVVEALFDYFEQMNYRSVLFSKILNEGPFANVLYAVIKEKNCIFSIINKTRRAVLPITYDADVYFKNNCRGKKLKELNRQRRRLNDLHPLHFNIVHEPEDINSAIERFLALEITGWKGRNGTGLLQGPGRAAFARAMMKELAITAQIDIHELYAGDVLVASGIVLKNKQTGSFWKITHDERFSRYSPGVLLTQTVTAHYLNQKQLFRLDSCAVEGHPMIDGLWSGRLEIVDLLVSVSSQKTAAFWFVQAREIFKRRVRKWLRARYIQFKGGKNN